MNGFFLFHTFGNILDLYVATNNYMINF